MIQDMPPDEEKSIAEKFARDNNLPVRLKYIDGTVVEIKRLSATGKPMYYKTFNLDAAKTISSDAVWKGGSSGLDLSGAGMVIGIWDGGVVRASHNEFGGRARIIDPNSETINHATHVAGTLGASGVRDLAHGMANKSTLDSYDWDNDNAEMRSAAGEGLLISNNSYGFIQGWEYNQDESRWEWWGNENISETEDYQFGFYDQDARIWDEIAYDHPKFLIVKSAGNDRGEGPASGTTHYIYRNGSWVENNTIRDLDGGSDSFDCIGTQGTSKNILSVGAVQDLPNGYTDSTDVKIASFSAFGPTDDGRIKPDIVGNGIGLYSSYSSTDDSYGFMSGTSMSSPNIAGSLALLQQHFHNLHGEFLYSSQLKALVFHTAYDAGNKGPDYKYGWGLMNTASAADVITTIPEDRFFYDTLINQESKSYSFYSTGTEDIKITIVWTDPAGDIPPVKLNPTNKILVNDIDIRLTRQIDDHVFSPFVLDPAIPFQPAFTGDNNRDNAEQIQIEQPMAGFYTLSVSHKLSLSGSSQPYAMVITGLNKDYLASGYNILKEANGTILLTSTDHYVNNMDVQWLIQPDNDGPVSIYFDYFETELSQDVLTIYDGKDEMAPVLAEFSGDLAIADTIVTSTFREMYVTFTSDSQVTLRGFLARYCTMVPEGEFSIIGEPYPCELSVSSYFAIGQEGTEFSWAVDEGWSFEQKSSNGIDLSIGDTSTVLSLMPYNRCGSGSPSEITIAPLTSQPYLTSIVGDTIPCAGHSTLLSTNSLPGARFEWQLPVSWLGSSETDTIHYIPSVSNGTVTVTGYNACGKGNEISRYIDVLDVPESSVILTDRVPPCAYTVQDFYVQGTPGYDYLWEVQDDWEIIGESNRDTVTIKVGGTQNFIFLTSANKCGDNNTYRLFLTAPVPPLPKVSISDGSFGYPELRVANFSDFEAIQWYRNGLPVPGENGSSNPFIINLNGLYTVESISDQGCTNLIPAEDGIAVDRKQLVIRTYRINKTTIVIENASSSSAGFNIVSLSGKVLLAGEVHPGLNEIRFLDNGIFLIQFYGNGIDQKYKAFF